MIKLQILSVFVTLLFVGSINAQIQVQLYSGKVPNSRNLPSAEREVHRGERNRAYHDTNIPSIAVFTPEKPNGTAVIIYPGGGYRYTTFDKEGVLAAERLIDKGITTFVVKYRLPLEEYNIASSLAPLQDAQQAIRYVRSNAKKYDIDPSKIGVLGFSAGGHLAASASTLFYDNSDETEKNEISVRPDFTGLVYPVISFDDKITHAGSKTALIGENPSQELVDLWSLDKQVSWATPPTFIVHSGDDYSVPVENSIRYYQACISNRVPVEMHIYPSGGHGFGLYNMTTKDDWIERFIRWTQELHETKYVPKDSIYTVASTFQKLKKEYPNIEIAEARIESTFIEKNVIYAEINENRKLHMDIFRPFDQGEQVLPTVLMIHGGGWKRGRKENMTSMARSLSERGYIVANVEYRLSDESPYPAGVLDVKRALRYLKINAVKYKIDTSRFVVLGTSAGAQLASLVGSTPNEKAFQTKDEAEVSEEVTAVINIDGIVSFTHPEAKPEWTGPSANAWLGGFGKANTNWEEASPLKYAGNHLPAFLFVNSSFPRFHAGRDDLINILDNYNIYSEVYTLDESPHSFWFFDPWFETTLDKCDQFLKKITKSQKRDE